MGPPTNDNGPTGSQVVEGEWKGQDSSGWWLWLVLAEGRLPSLSAYEVARDAALLASERALTSSATPSCNLLIAGALLLRTEVVPQRCQKRDCSHAAARVRPCVANLEHIPQTYPQ